MAIVPDRTRPEILQITVLCNCGMIAAAGNDYKAIPYYAVGNARTGDRYQVWVPVRSKE